MTRLWLDLYIGLGQKSTVSAPSFRIHIVYQWVVSKLRSH